MNEYVYVIQVNPKGGQSRVSSEAYKTLGQAQAFIENRSDKPEKFSEFIYESEENLYLIFQLKIFN